MILRKWNYKTHKYDNHIMNDDLNIKLMTDDYNEIVNCASCGKDIKYKNTYVSLEIHTNIGMGYPVCSKCYKEEIERRLKYDSE